MYCCSNDFFVMELATFVIDLSGHHVFLFEQFFLGLVTSSSDGFCVGHTQMTSKFQIDASPNLKILVANYQRLPYLPSHIYATMANRLGRLVATTKTIAWNVHGHLMLLFRHSVATIPMSGIKQHQTYLIPGGSRSILPDVCSTVLMVSSEPTSCRICSPSSWSFFVMFLPCRSMSSLQCV